MKPAGCPHPLTAVETRRWRVYLQWRVYLRWRVYLQWCVYADERRRTAAHPRPA